VREADRFRPHLWSFAYLAVRRMLSLVVLVLRDSGSKEIEILELRHELEILRRHQPRPRLEPADRACSRSRATRSWRGATTSTSIGLPEPEGVGLG
jgi:hypothetical protein